ncbi:hypothetical protein B296_00024337 [Ensete ventricosum]|uniref:Uncharacterized protein n=1 Tax=Ensete ventricosum TaxID=4639 RepID=A0A426YP65_ENSVE|nr:hypothetical protein B296_00024337 [Ensete ventricosum]
MGLITYNRIYLCIGASPCPVIVDLVIIGSSDHRITMRRDLPPWHHGSRCNLHAPATPLHPPLRAGRSRPLPRVAAPYGLLPLRATAPLHGGLAVASSPLTRGLGYSRLPLVASHDQPLLVVVFTANVLNDSM